jgi:predicted RNA polymerase sigma factor
MHSSVHQAIATVWRLESARVTAAVARMVRDIGVAEELAQDALVAAGAGLNTGLPTASPTTRVPGS